MFDKVSVQWGRPQRGPAQQSLQCGLSQDLHESFLCGCTHELTSQGNILVTGVKNDGLSQKNSANNQKLKVNKGFGEPFTARYHGSILHLKNIKT